MKASFPRNAKEEEEEEGDDGFLLHAMKASIKEIIIDEEDLPYVDDYDDNDDDDDDDVEEEEEEEEDAEPCICTFTGHKDAETKKGEVYTVAFSPTDPTLVATGGNDNKGFLWKISQGDSVLEGNDEGYFWKINQGDWPFELQGHKESVSAVAFSTDGKLLASGCLDGLIQIWDTSSKYLKPPLKGSVGGIEWLRWHPDPRRHLVLAGAEDFTVGMWNADSGTYRLFYGHGGRVTCGDFTPDGKTICTGSDDATLRIWNPKSGESICVRGHNQGLTCLVISSNSTFALTGSKDGSVHIVNITNGKVVGAVLHNSEVPHSESVECVGLSKSSALNLAATGGSDGKLIIWDLRHLSSRFICIHKDRVNCLTWLGASKYVATGCADGKIRLWDSLSGECVKTFIGHSNEILSLAVSAGGDFLVSVSFDGEARVFDISRTFK